MARPATCPHSPAAVRRATPTPSREPSQSAPSGSEGDAVHAEEQQFVRGPRRPGRVVAPGQEGPRGPPVRIAVRIDAQPGAPERAVPLGDHARARLGQADRGPGGAVPAPEPVLGADPLDQRPHRPALHGGREHQAVERAEPLPPGRAAIPAEDAVSEGAGEQQRVPHGLQGGDPEVGQTGHLGREHVGGEARHPLLRADPQVVAEEGERA